MAIGHRVHPSAMEHMFSGHRIYSMAMEHIFYGHRIYSMAREQMFYGHRVHSMAYGHRTNVLWPLLPWSIFEQSIASPLVLRRARGAGAGLAPTGRGKPRSPQIENNCNQSSNSSLLGEQQALFPPTRPKLNASASIWIPINLELAFGSFGLADRPLPPPAPPDFDNSNRPSLQTQEALFPPPRLKLSSKASTWIPNNPFDQAVQAGQEFRNEFEAIAMSVRSAMECVNGAITVEALQVAHGWSIVAEASPAFVAMAKVMLITMGASDGQELDYFSAISYY